MLAVIESVGSQPSQAMSPYEPSEPQVQTQNFTEADEEINKMLEEEEAQNKQDFYDESAALDNAVTELKSYLDNNSEENQAMRRTFELTKIDHFGYRLEQMQAQEGQWREALDISLRLDQDTIMILLQDGEFARVQFCDITAFAFTVYRNVRK